uniref:succinylglutamate desuccinylase/aspartoacylase family protein n=1 Tax=Lawsonibacter celer TaxID=2986526 RepID=UPI0016468C7C
VHPVNVPAFQAKLQYVGPYDGKNLNREYPGLATGTVTQRIAYTISSQLFTQADFYMDLHGGDIHESLTPFVIYSKLGDEAQTKLSLEASKALGVKYVCGSVSTNGTFGCAATMGVPGFLGEIGNCGLWSEDEVKQYVDGVSNVLRLLKVLPGEVVENKEAVVVDHMTGLDAQQTGCWYPCVKINDVVKKGQKLGEIRDYFTNVLGEYFAPCDGVMLYVISSLPINAGDPIIAIG